MQLAIPAQERPARNALTVGVSCVTRTRKPVARVARSSARPVFYSIKRSTRSPHTENVGREKELKTSRTAASDLSGFFPVSEGHKLIQNFLQSLEPPFLVGGCSCVSPVHMRAVRFTNLGYFFPKFLDTLRHQSRHKHSLMNRVLRVM
jgi:hypothetical protein